jgi:hypothetical protein
MTFIWKLPGEPPNPDAIARMRQHFPKPPEPMPEAWFMGNEIYFYRGLDGNTDSEELCRALDQIKVGITAFPEVPFVPLWKDWFRYLLPDLILRANDPENFNYFGTAILAKTIAAFFIIYPENIEAYPGFRDDVIATLGTRAIPHKLARDTIVDRKDHNRLFVDIWDESHALEYYGFPSLGEVNSSIMFCLKYLTLTEVSDWTLSLFQIESPQWYLQMMFSLTAWRRFVLQIKERGKTADLDDMLKSSGISGEIRTQLFDSFDDLISPANVQAFEQVIAEQLSIELVYVWKTSILKELDVSTYNLQHEKYLNEVFESEVKACEKVLFPEYF